MERAGGDSIMKNPPAHLAAIRVAVRLPKDNKRGSMMKTGEIRELSLPFFNGIRGYIGIILQERQDVVREGVAVVDIIVLSGGIFHGSDFGIVAICRVPLA